MNSIDDRPRWRTSFPRALGDRASRIAAIAVPTVVLSALTLFATVGVLDRLRTDEPYVLFLHTLADRPLFVVALLAISAGIYGSIFWLLVRLTRRWTSPEALAVASGGRLVRWTNWTLARWWRASGLIAIAWLPLYIMQFPGTSNADLVMQTLEVLSDRAALDYPPFDVYPTGYYLIPNDEILLSNHHNVFLTLGYGHTLGASVAIFGTFKPGLLLLTSTQAIVTLIAFGRGMSLVAGHVASTQLRVAALIALVVCGYPVAMWSVAMAKNPLLAAALFWWLALSIDHVVGRRDATRRRIIEWAFMTLLILISAKFGVYIVAAQIVILVLARWGRRPAGTVLVALGAPLVIFEVALRIGFGAGLVIPGDPLAGRGLQIQSLAVALREDPAVLSDADAAALEPIFDIDVMIEDFSQWTMAPIRGAGYRDGAYQWRTVTSDEVAEFNGIWRNVLTSDPVTVIDGGILKTFRFFDPLTDGRDNFPTNTNDDGIQAVQINGYTLSDDGTNDFLRWLLSGASRWISSTPVISLILESSVRVVLVVLLATVGIALRRPAVWVWATPLALHAGVLVGAPLSSSGRYALGITYALPLAILALGIVMDRDRAGASEEKRTLRPTSR